MKEYQVMASVFNDLLMPSVVENTLSKDPRYSTSVHAIVCNSLEEIPDAFLDVCDHECVHMQNGMYWYVDDGSGWVLVEL